MFLVREKYLHVSGNCRLSRTESCGVTDCYPPSLYWWRVVSIPEEIFD
jgi:hypothetical protein